MSDTPTLRVSSSFMILATPVTVTLEAKRAQALDNPNARTTDLQPIPADALDYSFTGQMPGWAGQCQDAIRVLAGKADAPDVARLCDLWARIHLNGMKAGTERQTEALADMPDDKGAYFTRAVAFLEAKRLYVDRGYTYGSAWLYRPIDSALYGEAFRLMDRLNGQRFGSLVEPGASLVKDEMSGNGQDVLASGDLIKRCEYLRDWLAQYEEARAAAEDDGDELTDEDDNEAAQARSELEPLEALAAAVGGEWVSGVTLVRDSYFKDYAKEEAEGMGLVSMQAEGMGLVSMQAEWPYTCIDWDAAAAALQQDYSQVDYDGVTYWFRG